MPLIARRLPAGCSDQMLDAVAAWICAQLSAQHVRAAERELARVAPGIRGLLAASPPVEEVTPAQMARFRARLRRGLPAAARRAAAGRPMRILHLRRDSTPVAAALRAAGLTGFYLPEQLSVLVADGHVHGWIARELTLTSMHMNWQPPSGTADARW